MDEVGRGAWAGPVSVAIAVLGENTSAASQPALLRDSKMLSEKRREEIFCEVGEWCSDWAVGHVEAQECDRLGMVAAIRLAGFRALCQIERTPDVVLLDGPVDLLKERTSTTSSTDRNCDERGGYTSRSISPGPSESVLGGLWPLPEVIPVTRGDATCASISAASVLAKVARDRLMREQAGLFPDFGFERNKGYPSIEHRSALSRVGLTPIHRQSWSFARDLTFEIGSDESARDPREPT